MKPSARHKSQKIRHCHPEQADRVVVVEEPEK
jgi:hypothetical protein